MRKSIDLLTDFLPELTDGNLFTTFNTHLKPFDAKTESNLLKKIVNETLITAKTELVKLLDTVLKERLSEFNVLFADEHFNMTTTRSLQSQLKSHFRELILFTQNQMREHTIDLSRKYYEFALFYDDNLKIALKYRTHERYLSSQNLNDVRLVASDEWHSLDALLNKWAVELAENIKYALNTEKHCFKLANNADFTAKKIPLITESRYLQLIQLAHKNPLSTYFLTSANYENFANKTVTGDYLATRENIIAGLEVAPEIKDADTQQTASRRKLKV